MNAESNIASNYIASLPNAEQAISYLLMKLNDMETDRNQLRADIALIRLQHQQEINEHP